MPNDDFRPAVEQKGLFVYLNINKQSTDIHAGSWNTYIRSPERGLQDLPVRAIGSMRIFSTTGQRLSNCSFCHVHLYKLFFYLLLSLTKAKRTRKLLRKNKPFLTSISIYLVSAAACASWPHQYDDFSQAEDHHHISQPYI